MNFARPLVLLLLVAIPVWWWQRARRLARVAGTRMSDLRPFSGASGREWLTRVPPGLRSACLAA
ncbi:MAG TPA: hypothetical protein VNH63_09255, partial [Gemmatimonadales bacterium]|nr:hypothetical protein [Gemmatimonadales bacterium]